MRLALKAAEELKAEQAAHCRSKKEMAEMAVELKNAADRCKLLEKEDRAVQEEPGEVHYRGQGCSLCDESYEGGAALGRRYRGWKALPAAEEVHGS